MIIYDYNYRGRLLKMSEYWDEAWENAAKSITPEFLESGDNIEDSEE